jgi:putative hemolysin
MSGEIAFILLLILTNGFLAMAEMAIVSARKFHIRERAAAGDKRSQDVSALLAKPEIFLSTVQIGITLIGIFAGAFGGASIAVGLSASIAEIAVLAPYKEAIAVGLVVAGITFCSLLFGELVPKRLALAYPDALARAVAPTMLGLSRAVKPFAHFLSLATKGIIWVLRIPPPSEPAVTEEEVKAMIEQGAKKGAFLPTEKDMIYRVFRLADRSVRALMTPRPDIAWLNIDDEPEALQRRIADKAYSFFPVARGGNLDDIIGVARSKNILAQAMMNAPLDIQATLSPALFIPETTPALKALELFKQCGAHLGLVIDEYGLVSGLITFDDILSSIFEDVPDADNDVYTPIVARNDGSLLIDGLLPIDEFTDVLGIPRLSEAEQAGYQTVGGLVMGLLDAVPSEGKFCLWKGWRLQVVNMDGRRVAKILAQQNGARGRHG